MFLLIIASLSLSGMHTQNWKIKGYYESFGVLLIIYFLPRLLFSCVSCIYDSLPYSFSSFPSVAIGYRMSGSLYWILWVNM